MSDFVLGSYVLPSKPKTKSDVPYLEEASRPIDEGESEGSTDHKRKGNWVFLCFLCALLFEDETDIELTSAGSRGLSSPLKIRLEQKKTKVTKDLIPR